jgi:hypothetical protein
MIKFAALIIKVNNVKLKVMSKIDSFYLPQLPRNENIGFHSKPIEQRIKANHIPVLWLLCGVGIVNEYVCDMKKILILLMLILITVSCDTISYDYFIVVNNCNEEITISVTLFNDKPLNFTVVEQNEYSFYDSEGIPAKESNIVSLAFKQITVTKNGVVSQKNYMDKTKWIYVDVDETHSKVLFTR